MNFARKPSLFLIFTGLTFLTSIAWAESVKRNEDAPDWLKMKPIEEYIMKNGVENKLRLMLGKNYIQFKENFKNTTVPALLKNKAIFIAGYRDIQENRLTGALHILPDGRLYVAYYDRKNNIVNYYGPKGEDVPRVIQIWRNELVPQYSIHEVDDENFKSFNIQPTVSDGYNDGYERFEKVMYSIWDREFLKLQQIQVNDSVADIITKAEQSIYGCSIKVGWVPNFSFVPPNVLDQSYKKFIQDHFEEVLVANHQMSQNKRYKICIDIAALNYKSDLVLTNQDI